jgi:transcriptional regulator with XRE-family HTH domain
MAFSPQKLKKYREASGMSQFALGKSAGCTKQQISFYELRAAKPNADTLEGIARALGIMIDDLFESKRRKSKAVSQ